MSNTPHYSLPGIVHYLQAEWTRNEKDRIQWANEREEMKATISKLQSENDRLKKQIQAQGNNLKDLEPPMQETDVDSLRRAREHLQERMDEVMYLLRGSGSNVDLLGIKDYTPFAKKEREKPLEITKKVILNRNSHAIEKTIELDVEETEPEIETDNETLAGDSVELNENPSASDKFGLNEGKTDNNKAPKDESGDLKVKN